MDELYVNSRVRIPESELAEKFARSGGPGGQHVNKTSTKVELRWNPGTSRVLRDSERRAIVARLKLTGDGDVVVTSDATRDQSRNRRDARAKLAAVVRSALVRRRRRVATKPSSGAVERRLKAKKKRSALKRQRAMRD